MEFTEQEAKKIIEGMREYAKTERQKKPKPKKRTNHK